MHRCDYLGIDIMRLSAWPSSPCGNILVGPFDLSAVQARLSFYVQDSRFENKELLCMVYEVNGLLFL